MSEILLGVLLAAWHLLPVLLFVALATGLWKISPAMTTRATATSRDSREPERLPALPSQPRRGKHEYANIGARRSLWG